jgi:hypothetical protein
MNWTRTAIVVLSSGWFFLASCTTGMIVGLPLAAKLDARDAASGDTMHSQFSVVIESATGEEPFGAVHLRALERLEDYSGNYLLSRPNGSFETEDSEYTFEVLEETDAGQVIEVVEAYKDGDNTIWSRYRATGSSLTPISSRMMYFGYGFAAFPYAFGFAFVLYMIGRVIAFRNPQAAKTLVRKKPNRKYTLAIFIVVYGLGLIVTYVVTTPTETPPFDERVNWNFTLAGVITGDVTNNQRFRVLNLQQLKTGNVDLSEMTFLLPRPTVTIDVGDIHRVEVLEFHDDWQLVAFHYSNTRTSTAVYRAYANRIEPVSYRVTSTAGHLAYAAVLLIPAFLISRIIAGFLGWRARRSSKTLA